MRKANQKKKETHENPSDRRRHPAIDSIATRSDKSNGAALSKIERSLIDATRLASQIEFKILAYLIRITLLEVETLREEGGAASKTQPCPVNDG